MIVCAGNNETFAFAHPIGVGLVDSAINLTRLSLFDKPEFLIFVGSAGSYGEAKILDIKESLIASNIENSFWKNDSYTPIDNVIEAKRKEDENSIIVNSSNYITTNMDYSKYYLKHNIHLENMEFFSVMRVAGEFGIPALGIFVVTNYTDKDAHKDFMQNHQKAKKLLEEYIYTKYKDLKK